MSCDAAWPICCSQPCCLRACLHRKASPVGAMTSRSLSLAHVRPEACHSQRSHPTVHKHHKGVDNHLCLNTAPKSADYHACEAHWHDNVHVCLLFRFRVLERVVSSQEGCGWELGSGTHCAILSRLPARPARPLSRPILFGAPRPPPA